MVILGIHDGHDSSVALSKNGEILYASQEERFTNLKGDYGFPKNAIRDCLKSTNTKLEDIDQVALASKFTNPILMKLKRNAQFSVSDWIKEQELYWQPKIYQNKKVSYWNVFKKNKNFKQDNIYDYKNILKVYMSKKELNLFYKRRIEKISKLIKIEKKKIITHFHEDCHKYYAYYFFKERKDGLAITAEGLGDYSNGSVSTLKNSTFSLKAANTKNHIGHIYQYITLLLGMKPMSHEYKVMGLAPYTSLYEINKCFKTFDEILKINKLNVVFRKKPKDLFFHFKSKFKDCRFDGIAGALQLFTEKKLEEWFLSCVKILKLNNIYFSGGVAQNIKAIMYLIKNKKFKNIFVPPAAGDTSLSIGACFKSNADLCIKKGLSPNKFIKPIKNMYLGYKVKDEDLKKYIRKKRLFKRYEIIKNVSSKRIAKEIFDGKIIARCAGRMEFGLRSLGNRSILCDPRKFANIQKINSKIKKRDFWMPFTPTIIKEDFDKFIVNPNKIVSKFMAMAFETTKLGQSKIQAAIHPADYTARPQFLERNDNPKYYEIIKEFKKLSGVGALLNTSFNLHGLPVVRDISDAFYTFENSDLDFLIIEKMMFKKK